MSKKVTKQIDQILDSIDDESMSIILQIKPEQHVLDLETRMMGLTADSVFDRQMLTSSISRYEVGSFVEHYVKSKNRADSNAVGIERQDFKSQWDQNFGTFINQSSIKEAISSSLKSEIGASEFSKSDLARLGRLQELPLAHAVAVNITKENLHKFKKQFSESGNGVRGVYKNLNISLPRVSEAKELPSNVSRQRASAWGVHAINATAAWGAYGVKGQGVKVAVLDTGIDPDHPDLVGKIDEFAEFDSMGQQILGVQTRDSARHGTHVAGTVVGGSESGKWIGVAPQAEVMAGLVLPGGSGTTAQIIGGMGWAVKNGAHIVNLSLGGGETLFNEQVSPIFTSSLASALRQGVLVVAAVGNEGSQTSGEPGSHLFSFSVGATNHQDRAAGFSGGRTKKIKLPGSSFDQIYTVPNVTAPGVAVTSAIPVIPGEDAKKAYATLNGTSMAAPHVSGAAALLLSGLTFPADYGPFDRVFALRDLLEASVEDLGESGVDHRYGWGRIDVLQALSMANDAGWLANTHLDAA